MGEAQAGAESEHMEGCCSLPAPPGLLRLSSYTAQDHLPKDGTDHSRLDLSHQINDQENAPRGLPTRDLRGDVFLDCHTLFSGSFNLCQVDERKLTKTPKLATRHVSHLARPPLLHPHPKRS